MIGNIMSGKRISHVVWYHHQKVENGVAELLFVRNFGEGCESIGDKIDYLEKRAALNRRGKKHCFHASISWPPGTRLDKEKSPLFIDTFMNRIGLDHQPFLAYQHLDTASPHIHIVSVWIDEHGKKLLNPSRGLLHKVHLELCEFFESPRDRQLKFNRNSYNYRPIPPPFLEESASPPLNYGKET